jgi:tRNA threonylcarbamoyladenosine biosynthesis protein TsaB
LIPAVLAMLAEADMPLASLDAIVFGRGPGSFTGLRTACAVAQGLAFGSDVPVLPVDTLLAVAEEARWAQVQAGVITPDAELTVLALLDARMDEVYSAAYRWQPVSGESFWHWQEAAPLQVGAPEKLQMPDDRTVLQAGNAFAAYGDRLPRVAPGGLRCEALPTAAALLRLAPALWAQGLAVPAEQAMPLYIRDKVANTTAEREAMKAQAVEAKTALAKAAAQP